MKYYVFLSQDTLFSPSYDAAQNYSFLNFLFIIFTLHFAFTYIIRYNVICAVQYYIPNCTDLYLIFLFHHTNFLRYDPNLRTDYRRILWVHCIKIFFQSKKSIFFQSIEQILFIKY